MSGNGRHLRVLIVDDSPQDCDAVRRYLENDPNGRYTVREEYTGRAGLAAARAEPPDCLVVDYELPDMRGLDLIDLIGPPDERAALAIVMLTGKGDETVAVQALKRGVQDYLVKGHFTGEVFCQTIADAVRKVELTTALDRERDHTARLAAEVRARVDELAEANRRKDEFIALLAHELRNPLAPVRTGLELLRLAAGDNPDVERFRAMMARQIDHMVRLIDDLLDVSRIARGKVELRPEPIDLVPVLVRAAEGVRSRLDDRRLAFEPDLPDGPLAVYGDQVRLEQVFANLLTNAAKYTEPGGRVRLSAEAVGADVVVNVADTGIGIRPDQLDRIFEMFIQSDQASGQVADGLGLGLPLVRGLTEMHGGTVTVRSPGHGRGSEFIVRLPRLEVSLPHTEATPAPAPSANHRPLRILIVDDNDDGATALAGLLSVYGGHDVRIATDGPTALAMAPAFRPDVALLDIALPNGMDGYEVGRRLKEIDGLDGVVLITQTGYGQDADRQRSREFGAVAHLVKPLDPAVLAFHLAQV